MYAVMYDEIKIIKITISNLYEFRDYDQYKTFEEAKNSLISYWDNLKQDAILGINEAKILILFKNE